MVLKFDTSTIINDTLPYSLRYANVLELLNASLIYCKEQNDIFNDYQDDEYMIASIIPQVQSVEFILNIEIPLTGGSIYILDGDQNIDAYVFNRGEYNSNQLYENTRAEDAELTYFYERGENTYYDFYIQIPTAYSSNTIIKTSISNLISRLKPIGFSWTWKYY
jgi:hypothetical protein